MPPVLDVEDMMTCPSKSPPLDAIAEITAFLDAVRNALRLPAAIYTTPEYESAFCKAGSRTSATGRAAFIAADVPAGDWVFWQYHHRGRRDGIDGPVDLNAFRGTKEDFARFAGGEGCGRGR